MEIGVLQACVWLVLSRTCACAQVRSCVNDACPVPLSDRAVPVFVFLACARTLRLATDSHDHVMAQVRSEKRSPSFTFDTAFTADWNRLYLRRSTGRATFRPNG